MSTEQERESTSSYQPLIHWEKTKMENMLLGTGIFMLSMMGTTLAFSRLLSRPHGKDERKK